MSNVKKSPEVVTETALLAIPAAESQTGRRDPETIAAEIKALNIEVFDTFMKVGDLLNEARPYFTYGEWTEWVEKKTGYAYNYANQLMNLSKEYKNILPVAHLGVKKATALLAIPPAERESFIEELHEVNRTKKDKIETLFITAADMSTRELAAVIKKRNEDPMSETKTLINEYKMKRLSLSELAEQKNTLAPCHDETSKPLAADIKHIVHIEDCINALLDTLTTSTDNQIKLTALYADLRAVLEDALQRIPAEDPDPKPPAPKPPSKKQAPTGA